MNILILGASGFIGNACYGFFSQNNVVTGVDIRDSHAKGLLIDTDLHLTKKLIIEKKFDAIVNCAGSSNIKESFSSPQKDYLSNTAYVENIMQLLKHYSPQTKFINISSAAVYGNPEKLPITENTATSPLSPYGEHKLKTEGILRDYSERFKLKTLSVRIFSAYGIGLKQQFFHDLYSKFKANSEEVKLFGTGKESRDFIFISDIVEAFDILIRSGKFNGEIYNLAAGEESFIGDTALLFAEILNYKGKVHFTNEQMEGYPLNWRADIQKLKGLGFAPKVKITEGLKLYADWLKNNPS